MRLGSRGMNAKQSLFSAALWIACYSGLQGQTLVREPVVSTAAVRISPDRLSVMQEGDPAIKTPKGDERDSYGSKQEGNYGDKQDSKDPATKVDPNDAPELIAIPALKTPNIDVSMIGNKVLPKDMVANRLPPTVPMPNGALRGYDLYLINKQFEPSAICHKPLYFSDTMLERHGHQRFPCVQPLASGVRFFGTLPIMPYLMTLHPPGEDIYNLGHYRPGTAAPCLIERPPYDSRAMRNQIITTAGVFVAAPL